MTQPTIEIECTDALVQALQQAQVLLANQHFYDDARNVRQLLNLAVNTRALRAAFDKRQERLELVQR